MIKIVKATYEDSLGLAQMNKQLIEDEGHTNPMTVGELSKRMEGWLTSDWEAAFFELEDTRIGYALYQWRSDAFAPKQRVIYLRQFFVDRSHRRKGIGSQAFRSARESLWLDACRVEVEVSTTNATGVAFWRSLGFTDYSLSLKLGS